MNWPQVSSICGVFDLVVENILDEQKILSSKICTRCMCVRGKFPTAVWSSFRSWVAMFPCFYLNPGHAAQLSQCRSCKSTGLAFFKRLPLVWTSTIYTMANQSCLIQYCWLNKICKCQYFCPKFFKRLPLDNFDWDNGILVSNSSKGPPLEP